MIHIQASQSTKLKAKKISLIMIGNAIFSEESGAFLV
jgi:hypothetical protein